MAAGSRTHDAAQRSRITTRGNHDRVSTISNQALLRALHSNSRRLDEPTRVPLEQRFGRALGNVQLHTGPDASESARALHARAYTVGNHIVFGDGQYAPTTNAGRRLLAHEVTHALQQGHGTHQAPDVLGVSAPSDPAEREAARVAADSVDSTATSAFVDHGPSLPVRRAQPILQRDLLTYNAQHIEVAHASQNSVTLTTDTADAESIKAALKTLIDANKIGVRDMGDRTYVFARGASAADVSTALLAAGYPKAGDMATALLNDHDIYLYSHERLTMTNLSPITFATKEVVEKQGRRPLTNYERGEAVLVFRDSLKLDSIMLENAPVMSIGDIARTTPWTINFPQIWFDTPDMPWLIHELMHSWQYQHGVSLVTTIHYAITGWLDREVYRYGGEAGLVSRSAAGMGLTSFNTEQQGEIIKDYYVRAKNGQSIAAWTPFIDELRRA